MILLFLSLSLVQFAFGKECSVNFNQSETKDCVTCTKEPGQPSDKLVSLLRPLVNHVTDSKDQKIRIDRYRAYLSFLKDPASKKNCDNYQEFLKIHTKEFQRDLSECEKGLDLLERNKYVCEWVLNEFNNKMVDAIYGHWTEKKSNGEFVQIKGRSMDQVEGFIRAQAAWCNGKQKLFKSKIFLSCGDLNRWVEQMDLVKKVGESMKSDMARSNEPSADGLSPDEQKRQLLDNACKYFDKNPGTTFTKDLYMNCVTR